MADSVTPERAEDNDRPTHQRRAELVAELFHQHNEALIRFLAARMRSRQEAREVAQEAYVRMLNLDQPGAVSFMRAFLFRTAANLAIDRMRSRDRRAALQEAALFTQLGEVPTPDRSAVGVQEVEIVTRLISELPEKQREALVKVYQAHGMSPLSPMLGCLPMLLPMPVLFALYFVFQNTIEFRGVPFLWLADISLKDPYFIVPIIMGLSMFVLSIIGMRNSPPNPQAKMMAYVLPVMMTVFFLNLASGLNLYYAVQNLTAIPQQWLISNERAKSRTGPSTAHA